MAAIYHGAGADYPSGHVVFVTATIGYLGLCAWRHDMHRLSALAVALVVWVGPERVLSGVHTVSDMIAGYALAAAFLIPAEMCAEPKAGSVSLTASANRGRNT